MRKEKIKNVKCIICGKRRVKHQEWKDEREKEICLTCLSIDRVITNSLIVLWKVAKDKGLQFSFTTKLSPFQEEEIKE
jgi:late competence protein required for DNA uptake (superfamily II DNA/RNA helicase)